MALGVRITSPHVATSVADESIDSDAYVDGSIDTAHLAADAVDGTKIADDAIDSEHYTDGSIDNAHIADDAIDSEHYAAGSIDTAHIADNQVTAAKIFDLARGSLLIGNGSAATAELTVGSDNYVLTVDGSGDIGWEAAGSVSGAQTGITTILNTGVKIGRDSENLVDFATTDNKIIFRVNNVNDVEIVENALQPTTNDGAALGTTSLGWSDVHIASAGVINWVNGEMTITESDANTLTVAGGTLAATLSGGLTLPEAASVSIGTPLLASTDHTYSGLSAEMLCGDSNNIAAFDLVCIHTTTGEIIRADASAVGTARAIGIAPAAISDTATGTVLLQGFIRDDSWNWTIGGVIYNSETVGELTQTAPTTDGAFVQVVGIALSADVAYINPSLDIIEHA